MTTIDDVAQLRRARDCFFTVLMTGDQTTKSFGMPEGKDVEEELQQPEIAEIMHMAIWSNIASLLRYHIRHGTRAVAITHPYAMLTIVSAAWILNRMSSRIPNIIKLA